MQILQPMTTLSPSQKHSVALFFMWHDVHTFVLYSSKFFITLVNDINVFFYLIAWIDINAGNFFSCTMSEQLLFRRLTLSSCWDHPYWLLRQGPVIQLHQIETQPIWVSVSFEAQVGSTPTCDAFSWNCFQIHSITIDIVIKVLFWMLSLVIANDAKIGLKLRV